MTVSRKPKFVKGGVGGTIGGNASWKLGKIKKYKSDVPGGNSKLKNKSKLGFQVSFKF
tara:strand:- start:201 stop:374 length:174 start_codon:yes stop_codon:yes gene_type:complete